ncbi:MAG TPA: hypothetical protein VNX26_07680 [Candidatus Acidoferrum sp.]|nr:hypothetical protein [Candidatus Acidoferrum sp.]
MRALRFLNVAILSALVGSAALVYGQDEKQQEEKPARQEEPKSKQDEAKPPRQDEAKPSRQEKQVDRQDQKREEQSPDQAIPQKDKQEHPEMRGDRNQQGQEARGDHARPAGKGGHIPDDKFRAHFGHSHHFNARTVIVQGQPRFQYSGFTFELVEVWPADWAYTDDCYIDYIDGEYFLIDLFHPGVRIALIVVM